MSELVQHCSWYVVPVQRCVRDRLHKRAVHYCGKLATLKEAEATCNLGSHPRQKRASLEPLLFPAEYLSSVHTA